MPVLRGLNVTLGSQTVSTQLPEYPVPESDSVDIVRPLNIPSRNPSLLSSHRSPSPVVSVYVPAIPNIQFWVKYTINEIPNGTAFFVFRLFINGRLITTWGVDPRVRSSGASSRALYQPGPLYTVRGPSLNMTVREGYEARGFYFLAPPENLSTADDGGLISVLVYRAKGRTRKEPKLEEYICQKQYGVAFPSCGLIENSDQTTFWNYSLIESKSCPYAAFKFHYRSLASLQSLNIAPTNTLSPALSPKKTPVFTFPNASPVSSTGTSPSSSYSSQSTSSGSPGSPTRLRSTLSPQQQSLLSPCRSPTPRSRIPIASPTRHPRLLSPVSPSPSISPTLSPSRMRRTTEPLSQSRSLSPLKPGRLFPLLSPRLRPDLGPNALSPLRHLASPMSSSERLNCARADSPVSPSAGRRVSMLPLQTSFSHDSLYSSSGNGLGEYFPMTPNSRAVIVSAAIQTQELRRRKSAQSLSPSKIPVSVINGSPEKRLSVSPNLVKPLVVNRLLFPQKTPCT